MNSSKERWADVVGYEGSYKVSNKGIVKSMRRRRKNRYGYCYKRERILEPAEYYTGHLYVNLCLNSKGRSCAIHRLVLEAFVGPCPEGMECRHLDGDPKNNCLSNLKWGTKEEQYQDRVRHGRDERGEKSPNAKLNDDKVRAAKTLHATGEWSFERIGKLFRVSSATINLAVTGKQWKHVQ
jgi:hypothetical protein